MASALGFKAKVDPSLAHCYRPQRSCGQGNIFTPVYHSVHGGGCLVLGGVWSGATPQNFLKFFLGGIFFLGGGFFFYFDFLFFWGSSPPPEADSGIWSTSGRYASYWNAFLLLVCNRFLRFTSGATPADLLVAKPFLIHILKQIQALVGSSLISSVPLPHSM